MTLVGQRVMVINTSGCTENFMSGLSFVQRQGKFLISYTNMPRRRNCY